MIKLSGWVISKPGNNLVRILVRGEDRVEEMFDPAIIYNHRQPFDEGHSGNCQGGQIEGGGEFQMLITQEGKRQVKPLYRFLLIRRVLSAEAKHTTVQGF